MTFIQNNADICWFPKKKKKTILIFFRSITSLYILFHKKKSLYILLYKVNIGM